jgi:ferritin-like metal-binding protein YciE
MEEMRMEETLAATATPTDNAELEAAVAQIIIEIEHTIERMRQIQERTETLGSDTRAMLAQLKAV